MNRILAACVALLSLCVHGALAADAGNRLIMMGNAAAVSPYLTPGTLAPAPGGGAWTPTTNHTPQGSSFATETPVFIWDAIPKTTVNGVVPVCAIGAALKTSATQAAGYLFGIRKFEFFLNGGPEFDVTMPTLATPSGQPGFCAYVNTALLKTAAGARYDGAFRVTAIGIPFDGLPVNMTTDDTLVAPCVANCSLYLNSNQNGTLAWTNSTVYVNAGSGSDSNDCLSTGTACQTPCGALTKLHTYSLAHSPYPGDLSYGTVNHHAATYSNTNCATQYDAAYGPVVLQPDSSSTQANTIFAWTSDGFTKGFNVGRWMINGATVDMRPAYGATSADSQGIHSTYQSAGATQPNGVGMLSHVIYHGAGMSFGGAGNGSPFFQVGGRTPFYAACYITDSIVEDALFGDSGCNLVRNTQVTQIGSDAFHDTISVLNVTTDHVTPVVPGVATTVAGSPVVTITDTSGLASAGAGATSSYTGHSGATVCVPAGSKIAHIDSATQFTLTTGTGVLSCSGVVFSTGAHADIYQIDVALNTPKVWFGFSTDGTAGLNNSTVVTQGWPYVQSIPAGGSGPLTANNFAGYNINAVVANSLFGNGFFVAGNVDNWILLNMTLAGNSFTRATGVLTNMQIQNGQCFTPPGKIGTSAGITYYADPVLHPCH